MPTATVYRRIAELEAIGAIEKDGGRGGYRIGSRLYRLLASGVSTESLASRMAPAAAALAEATGEVCFAARLVDARVEIFLTEVPAEPAGAMVVPPHGPRPATICSAAKAILAHVPPALLADARTASIGLFPDLPAREEAIFLADLSAVRESGFAACIGDEDPDCASIAAPLRLSGGLGQLRIGLSGPRGRFSGKLEEGLSATLREHVERIEGSGRLDV
ncbi:IclR family transcriptional regulator domain-containing protein [Halovulum sp. GXIMD14794]